MTIEEEEPGTVPLVVDEDLWRLKIESDVDELKRGQACNAFAMHEQSEQLGELVQRTQDLVNLVEHSKRGARFVARVWAFFARNLHRLAKWALPIVVVFGAIVTYLRSKS